MAYATVDELRTYLKQVPLGAQMDIELTAVLARATSIIDEFLGFSFIAYGAASTINVPSHGGQYLTLPPHDPATPPTVINISGISYNTIAAITDFNVRQFRSRAVLWRLQPATAVSFWWPSPQWPTSLWPDPYYSVTAKWGYGPPPDAIVEVCLEVAVNIWRQKDRGMFTDVIGVDGSPAGSSVVVVRGAFTNQQTAVMSAIKAKYSEVIL